MDPKQDYTWIRGVREALLAGELIDAPAWVRQRASGLFQSTSPGFVQRVRATLTFDSRRVGLGHAGVRAAPAAATEGPWQLLYRGGDVDIDLLVRPSQDGRTLSVRGQALPLAGHDLGAHGLTGTAEAVPADKARSAAVLARSALEPTGEFAFPSLLRGRYDVLVRLGAREIELSNLEL